jgi:hypothetical protein
MGPQSVLVAAESVEVTAGLGGFLAFFLLALALYFLMRNMNARMRRMAYREAEEAKTAAAMEAKGPHRSETPSADDEPSSSADGASGSGSSGPAGPRDIG